MNVRWTELALADLREIQAYIERHSPQYALAMIERIFDRSELLADHPRLGQVVPEFEQDAVRELLEPPHRIIYRIAADRIDVLTVIHAARRRLPALAGQLGAD